MKYGICDISIIPCRAEPQETSELVTQLLFGETYKILEERKKWVRIRTSYDKYECWIDSKIAFRISKEQYKFHEKSSHACFNDVTGTLIKPDKTGVPIVLGSTLPQYKDDNCVLKAEQFLVLGEVVTKPDNNSKQKLAENALKYINAPYLWGGRSPFGIDCSGLTQLVYKLNGIKLPRDAYQQAEEGLSLSFIEEAEPGDLAFFDNKEGKIIHVGIILENNYIIHASGKVRIDRIDHQGIYNPENRKYSHRLRLMKKII